MSWLSVCKARWLSRSARPRQVQRNFARQLLASLSRRSCASRPRGKAVRASISSCLFLLHIAGCGTARSIPIVEAPAIPVKPVAAMTACQEPLLLDEQIESIDLATDMPAWIEATLLNHAENARRAAVCRLNHQALVEWIEVLP